MSQKIPLELWWLAADSKSLPPQLRRDVTQAAWLRAVLLDEPRTADELTPALEKAIPELKPLLDDYLAAKDAIRRASGPSARPLGQ
ncbi:MAG: hypothetical protein ABI967_02950 [bacterium]